MVPPARPAANARSMAGYFARSGLRKVRSPILTKSRRGQVDSLQGTRSGHDIVYRIGSRMSGQPSCKA